MQPALIFFMGSRHFQVLSILNKLQWVRKDCRRLQIDVCELRFRLYILWCIDSMLISFHSCTDRSRKCCRSPPRLVVIRLYEWGQRLQSAHCYRDSSDVLMRLSPSSNPDRPPPSPADQCHAAAPHVSAKAADVARFVNVKMTKPPPSARPIRPRPLSGKRDQHNHKVSHWTVSFPVSAYIKASTSTSISICAHLLENILTDLRFNFVMTLFSQNFNKMFKGMQQTKIISIFTTV